MKIYTKTGDFGTTSIIGGKRISKSDLQVDAYGSIDELNSSIGYFLSLYGNILSREYKALILQIQRDLFKIGGLLSFDFSEGKTFSLGFIDEADVNTIEKEIDEMQSSLSPLRGFVLPGGSVSSAYSHSVRCVCRRTERKMVALFERVCPQANKIMGIRKKCKECADENMQFFILAIQYMNRLSDFFYVLARFLNKEQGQEEPLV